MKKLLSFSSSTQTGKLAFVEASGRSQSILYPDPNAANTEWENQLKIWTADCQFMTLPTVSDHLEVTKLLLPKFIEKAADVLIRAGFAQPDGKTALIEKLKNLPLKKRDDITELAIKEKFIKPSQHEAMMKALEKIPLDSDSKTITLHLIRENLLKVNQESNFSSRILTLPNQPRLQLDGAEFCWRVKSLSSATKKLPETTINQDPCRIGDYWAGMIIADGKSNVISARQAIVEDLSKTSQKDYYAKPQKSGHRCFMSHLAVEDDDLGLIQTGELQITEKQQDTISKFTHKLKDIARSLSEASRGVVEALSFGARRMKCGEDKSVQSLSTKLSKIASSVEDARTYSNDVVNLRTGMNDLAIPGFERYPAKDCFLSYKRTKDFIVQAEDYSGISFKDLSQIVPAKAAGHSPIQTRTLN